MVEIHLYGTLRRYAAEPRPDWDSVVQIEPRPGDAVGTTLARLGIEPSEVCHVFLNGALLSTANSMGAWLGYQAMPASVPDEVTALGTTVQSGDRIGLFACDMALLVI